MALDIFKNKPVLFGLVIVGIVVLIAIFSGDEIKNGNLQQTPLPSPERVEIIDLREEKRRQAADYRNQIKAALPIYIENFTTSVNIPTTINIYYLESDGPEIVRLEIYGLSYLNEESDPSKNPNVTAYKESYGEAMKRLREKGVDPKKLIFIYGDKEYVRTTTNKWIAALKLAP